MTTTNDKFTIRRSQDADGDVWFHITDKTGRVNLLMLESDFVSLLDLMAVFASDCELTNEQPKVAGQDLSAIIQQYLRRFTSAESIDEPGVQIRTTDSILNELSDIADFEPNEIASFMLRAGYVTDYSPDGRHGWLMRRTD